MAAGPDDDDGWEYEYSATETETFYVDLDLSSINGIIKSKNAGDRKSLKKLGQSARDKAASKGQARSEVIEIEAIQDQEGDNDQADGGDGENENVEEQDNNNNLSQPQSPKEPGLFDEDDPTSRMQILDMDTTNPIISFNGQMYSCTWHDMLGTTMFISKHQEAPLHEPEISTEDYDLIGDTRIKLVGHKARTVPKVASKKRSRDEADEADEDLAPTAAFRQYVPDGRSLGTIKRTNPRTNIEIKQQASFLEKLIEVKKMRGETDTVRTFVDRYIVAADAKQARKAKRVAKGKEKEKNESDEQRLRREIHELNRRVVKGDNEALERLQEIYADMEEVEDEEAEDTIGLSALPAPTIHDAGSRVPTTEEQDTGVPHVPVSNPNGASENTALH